MTKGEPRRSSYYKCLLLSVLIPLLTVATIYLAYIIAVLYALSGRVHG